MTEFIEANETEVSVFKAMTAEPEDILRFPGARVTAEERRALKQSSHNQQTRHISQQQTFSHSSLPCSDDEDDEGDEGTQKGEMRCNDRLVDGFTETERQSPRDPWPCTSDPTLEPLKEEDALRKHCRAGLYHPRIKACVQARRIAKSLERMFKMV